MSTLTFYMKSGNKFEINYVDNWKVASDNGQMVSLEVTFKKPWWSFASHKRLIGKSLSVLNIEAIVETE